MSNEQKKEKTKLIDKFDKLKRTDPKKAMKIMTLFFGLVMIVVMSITNFTIAKDFDFVSWISGALILAGICVFGLFMGESMGADKMMERPNGLYQTAITNYKDFFIKVEPQLCFFGQWFSWFMPSELVNKKINILVSHGVELKKATNIVKYCSLSDVEQLVRHPIEVTDDEGNKVIIRKIEDFQVETVKYVLSGEVKLDSCSSAYYLTATGKSTNKSVLERGMQLDKEISFNKKINRIKKITFTVGVSLILALFAIDHVMGAGEAQAWMNLVSRIAALFTSFVSGWSSSVTEIRLKAEKIENKVTVLRLFNFDMVAKTFKPMSEEELAKKEYEEYKKTVVEPEIVEEKKTTIKALDNKSHLLK